MSGLAAYSLTDLIPVTPEVYLRLIVRQNQAVWPAQSLALGLCGLLLYRAWKGRFRFGFLLLAVPWIWVGITYHLQLYSPLNWFAVYFGYAFLLQAGLLIVAEWTVDTTAAKVPSIQAFYTGLTITLFSLIGYPLLAPLVGRSWLGAQSFGTTPDATALGTLGLLLLLPVNRWFLFVIPGLWCLISVLQSWGLQLYTGALPLFIGFLAVACSMCLEVLKGKS